MSQNPEPPPPPEFDPVTVATLAAKFIPPISLAAGWEQDPASIEQASRDEIQGPQEKVGQHVFNWPVDFLTPFEVVSENAVACARSLLDAATGYDFPSEVVATLAAKFIPPISLLSSWQEDPSEIQQEELLTSFRVVADAAVARAHLVLNAARGRRRPDFEKAESEKRDYQDYCEKWSVTASKQQAKFDKIGRGKDELPVIEALREAWPDVARAGKLHQNEETNLFHYYKSYLQACVEEDRARKNLPSLRVVFEDEASRTDRENAVPQDSRSVPPACIILPSPKDELVYHSRYPHLIDWLKQFKGPAGEPTSRWKQARSALQSIHGKDGAEESAKAQEAQAKRNAAVWDHSGPASGKKLTTSEGDREFRAYPGSKRGV